MRGQAYEQRVPSSSEKDWDKRDRRRARLYREWRVKLPQLLGNPYAGNAIIDVICDMTPPYIQDRKYWLTPGTVGGWLIVALQDYAKRRTA